MTLEAATARTDPFRALMLVEDPLTSAALETAIRAGREAGCDVLVASHGDETVRDLSQQAGIHYFEPAGPPGRGTTVSAAAKVARGMAMTHLIALDPAVDLGDGVLARVVARSKADPDAVVSAALREGTRQTVANFWFRVQTGIRIKDSTSGMRAYPLDVLEHLTPWSRGGAFDYEVLVRAAWAGVCIREVAAGGVRRKAGHGRPIVQRAVDGARFGLLNVHLTMRSITPWPHRKLAPKESRPGAAVSILHPWRSLKILVGQNISARRLGLAGALGVFLGTLPLVACHSIAVLFAAGFFRLSKVAALAASQLCMPPLVPALCIEAGYFIRHGEFLTEVSLRTLGQEALERVFEWFLGSLVLAPILAVCVGMIVYMMARQVERRAGSEADSSDTVSKLEN